MLIKNEQLLPCGQAEAWAALNDDALLQACIPGCESLTRTAPDRLEAVVAAALGPVRARFTGKLGFADIEAPKGYSLSFEGQAGPAGFSKGQALVALEPQGPQQTLLRYEAQVQIGGKLAQIGSRVIDAAAQKLIGEFFGRFEAELARRAAPVAATPAPAAPPAPPWWARWSRLWAWLRGRAPAPSR